jgi:hypothetical protein
LLFGKYKISDPPKCKKIINFPARPRKTDFTNMMRTSK